MKNCNECPNFYFDDNNIACCKAMKSKIPTGTKSYVVKMDDDSVICYPLGVQGFLSALYDIKEYNPTDKKIYHFIYGGEKEGTI